MAAKHVIVLDVGTTGIKALLFNEQRALVARTYHELQKVFQRRGWVEQDPNQLITISQQVLRECIATAGVALEDITSLGITNQRETIIAWDVTTGSALYPAIVWEDRRTAFSCWGLRLIGKQNAVRAQTGLTIDPYFSATKMAWILKHVPAAKDAWQHSNLRIGTVDTWLLWNLTEQKTFKTDYTNASRTLVFNLQTLTWDNELLQIFDVPAEVLPTPAPSASDFGTLRPEIVGRALPIRAVCGDQQASMYAAGTEPLCTKITYGTGAFLMQIIGDTMKTYPDFFTTVVPTPNGAITYAIESKVGECGSRITPALTDPVKLTRVFTEIATEVAAYTKKLPTAPDQLIADGGGIRSPELIAIQSQISGMPVTPQVIFDGTALGVAKLLIG